MPLFEGYVHTPGGYIPEEEIPELHFGAFVSSSFADGAPTHVAAKIEPPKSLETEVAAREARAAKFARAWRARALFIRGRV
jgi:hypothetical protein